LVVSLAERFPCDPSDIPNAFKQLLVDTAVFLASPDSEESISLKIPVFIEERTEKKGTFK